MTPTIFQTYARYNTWMNGNLYAGCEKIPDAQRKRDLGAFFKSIHGTLNHILIGDRMWMARFTGAPLPPVALSDILYEDFDELRAARQEFDGQIAAYVSTLTEHRLAQPFTFVSKAYSRTFTHPLWFLVLHMFNHQTHHRGQITTLMKQCGVDPGPTDFPVLPPAP